MPPEMLTLLADECSSRVSGYGARARKDLLRALLTLQRRNDTRPARPLSMNRPARLPSRRARARAGSAPDCFSSFNAARGPPLPPSPRLSRNGFGIAPSELGDGVATLYGRRAAAHDR